MGTRISLVWVTAALLALCSACGHGDGAGPADSVAARTAVSPAQTAWDALPPPSTLPIGTVARRTASYAEADLTLYGASYSTALPNQLITVQGAGLEFAPAYAGPTANFSQVALAMYLFDVEGYDRAPMLRSVWSVAPASPGDVWYGLANWGKDRWDWYRSPADFILQVASFAPYLNISGGLLLVVARTGTDPSTLDSVELAAPLPSAYLTANPPGGAPPLHTTLDASVSTAAEGSIIKYEFDTGNGVFTDNGTSATKAVVYSAAGQYAARVRITDSQMGKSIATKVVVVTGPWQHTYTRDGLDQIYAIAIASNGDIYACGLTNKLTSFEGGLVLKFDALGNLLWARGYAPNLGYARYEGCTLDQDGNLILCGLQSEGSYAALLQKWTPDGQIIWTRTFSGLDFAILNRVVANGNEIYAAGSSSLALLNDDIVAMRVSPDGTLVWSRRWTYGNDQGEGTYACAFRPSEVVGHSELLVGGSTNTTIGDPPPYAPLPVAIGWDDTGSLTRSWQLGDGSFNGYIKGLRFEGFAFNTRVVAMGVKFAAGGFQQFMLRSNLAGANEAGALYIQTGDLLEATDFAAVPGVTGYMLCGILTIGAQKYGYITAMDPASLTPSHNLYWDMANRGEVDLYALRAAPGGGVVMGGTTLTASTTSGELSLTTEAFTDGFRTINGNESDAGVIFSAPNGTTIELTDGTTDQITTGFAALVRYEPLAP